MAQEMTKVFDTPDGCDLVVTNVAEGKIEVTGWDKPQTQITAVQQSDDVEIEIRQDGRQVTAKTRVKRGFLNGLRRLGKKSAVDYTVYVPHSSNVDVRCVTAPVRVAEVEGTVRVENVDGSAELHHVSGKVELRQLRPDRATPR